jgi:ATP-binding cassette subfamily F protein uup
LLDFSGTLLLVSHDRAFLDNVVTSTLVLEGGGRVGEYAGGYTDWLRQRPMPESRLQPAAVAKRTYAPPAPKSRPTRKRKLSFSETSELATLPERIDAREQERDQLYAALADPAVLRDGGAVAAARLRLTALDTEIAELTARWETLETIAAGS